jgi:hypothetical protein
MSKSYANQYKMYDIDECAAKKPIGPRTAAEIVAFHHTSNYRAEREALDTQRSKEKMAKAKENLGRRWSRTKSAQRESEPTQRVPKAPQPTRPLSSMANPNEQRVSALSQPTAARSHKAKPTSALFQSTINPPAYGGISTKRPNLNPRKHNGPSSVCSSSASESVANLLSKSQHQKLLREQNNRDREQKAARERDKKDVANARQRKKAAEDAREGQRQKLINAAKKSGREISDADFNAELEAFMEEREVSLSISHVTGNDY